MNKKKGFFALNDADFWGNRDSDEEEEEEEGEKKHNEMKEDEKEREGKKDKSKKTAWAELEKDGEKERETDRDDGADVVSNGDKEEGGEWIDVRERSHHHHKDNHHGNQGPPAMHHPPYPYPHHHHYTNNNTSNIPGGYSTPSPAHHHHHYGSPAQRPTARRPSYVEVNKTAEAQATLLSKKNFTALEVLNTMCRPNAPTPPKQRLTSASTPAVPTVTSAGAVHSDSTTSTPRRAPYPPSGSQNSQNSSPFRTGPCGGFSRPSFGPKAPLPQSPAPQSGYYPPSMPKPSPTMNNNNNPPPAPVGVGGGFNPVPQSKDASGFGAGLGRFKRPSTNTKEVEPPQLAWGDDDPAEPTDEDEMSFCEEKLRDPFHDHSQAPRPPSQLVPYARQEPKEIKIDLDKAQLVNLMDENYIVYYEHLCRGVQELCESETMFDCETNSFHEPFGNSTVCRALKSKYYYHYSPGPEVYSRKVFVGGLPIDIDEEELVSTFSSFGPLTVDWPNKNETKSYFPPKGYVFLIFEYEMSVRALVHNCFLEDEKYFLYITRPSTPTNKLVQIRPWRLADADYLVDVNIPINPRRIVFVGGVPRPIRAVELAHIMDRLYGSVYCAGIDTDVEYKYPKGAGRVAFSSYSSYMRAITDRYALLSHGEVEKRVEMKPYVLDDQTCEECRARHAPFFCPQLECLQYYCETCWTHIHGALEGDDSRDSHQPLIKEA
ncbi:unnamed protein product, partial [Mesorhabditis spiculigera]